MKLVRAAGLKPLLSLIPLFLLGLVLVVLARMIDAADKHAAPGASFRRGFLTDGDAWSLSAGQDRRRKDHGHAGRQRAERDHGRGRGVDRGHVCRARHRPASGSDTAAASRRADRRGRAEATGHALRAAPRHRRGQSLPVDRCPDLLGDVEAVDRGPAADPARLSRLRAEPTLAARLSNEDCIPVAWSPGSIPAGTSDATMVTSVPSAAG